MVVVELERAAHRLEVGLAQRGAHGVLVLDLAAHIRNRRVDEFDGVVAERSEGGGQAVVLRGERGDELLVRRIVEVGRPVRAHDDAERGIPLRGEGERVCDRVFGVERQLVLQSRLGVLLDEGDAAGAHQEGEHRVGLFGADAGDLGREVELGQRRVDRADGLAFEVANGGADMLVAGLIVRAEEKRALDALVGHVFADGRRPVVVRERDEEAVRVAFLARELQRPSQRADREDAGVDERFEHRNERIRGAEPGDEVDLGVVDELRCSLHRFGRIGLVVDHGVLDRQTAELVAELFEGEIDAALGLGACG